jgi:hypothetical protein
MNRDLSPYFISRERQGQPVPLALPSWGEAKAHKGLQDCVRDLKHRRRGTALTISPSWLMKSRLPKWMSAPGVYSMRGPPLALVVAPRILDRGGQASASLTASPSPMKGKSRLPKRMSFWETDWCRSWPSGA